MKTTLIRGGTVVMSQSVSQQDVLIQGKSIAVVGTFANQTADTIIDAGGLLVLPGGVDTHVHFNDEFMGTVSVHNYETGTRAAAFGGTTSVIDFSNPAPGETLMSTIAKKEREAAGKALIDWGVHPTITVHANHSLEKTIAEIPAVVAAGSPTLKCYMTYRHEGLLMEEAQLRPILAALRNANGMLLVHAEDNDLAEEMIPRFLTAGRTAAIYHAESKPPLVENRAIANVIRIAQDVGGRLFIVHLTTTEGVELIRQARAKGIDVIAETCTHYLYFTSDVLRRNDGIKWICSPPLRDRRAQEALWQGLRDGRLSQVTSDDAAYAWAAKRFGEERFDLVPNGIPGIEPRFHLLYSEGVAKGRISLPRFVELVAANPARLFGMTNKGTLSPGKDADIVLMDPDARWRMNRDTLHMATDWSAYEGIEIQGKIQKVFACGELIIDGDDCLARPGQGRYLHRVLDPNASP